MPDEGADYLPQSLKEMIPEIGISGVRRLVQKCGGMMFKSLPPHPRADHLLVRLVGLDLAHRICRIHAHCDLYIPRATRMTEAQRNAEIVARYSAGMPVNELVHEYRLSERWIRTILNRPVADPRQLALNLSGEDHPSFPDFPS
ncbi:MAG: hypothetical protein HQM03_20840 [Magnetococcales bacterium]|nr:hypothetical protein [Magnetococcales bacterium]